MKRALVTVAILTVMTATTGIAEARRTATADEIAQIAATVDMPPHCIVAEVTTMPTPKPIAAVRAAGALGCPVADGWTVLEEFHPTHWSVFDSGSDPINTLCAWLDEIPAGVALDLGLCSRPSRQRYVPCSGRSGQVRLRRRPHACADTLGAANTWWILRSLRWSTWSATEARGRALSMPSHLSGPREPGRPVTVRLSTVRYYCGPARPAFTRIEIRGRRFLYRVRQWNGEWFEAKLAPFIERRKLSDDGC